MTRKWNIKDKILVTIESIHYLVRKACLESKKIALGMESNTVITNLVCSNSGQSVQGYKQALCINNNLRMYESTPAYMRDPRFFCEV